MANEPAAVGPAPTASPGDVAPRGGARALFVVLGILVALGAIGGWLYLSYVQSRRDAAYARNYRVLGSLGSQAESRLAARAEAFTNWGPKPGAKPNRKTQGICDRAAAKARIRGDDGGTPPHVEITTSAGCTGSLRMPGLFDGIISASPSGTGAPTSMFDATIVHTGEGIVLYSDERSESAFPRSSRLLPIDGELPQTTATATDEEKPKTDPGEPTEMLGVGRPSQLEVEGQRWLLFSQPLAIETCSADAGSKPPPQETQTCSSQGPLYLGGVIREGRLAGEVRSVPLETVPRIGFVLALALMGWPLLKISLMGQRERLRAFDVYVLVVSALVGTAVVALLVTHEYARIRLRDRLNDDTRTLAAAVQANLRRQLAAGARALDAFVDGERTDPTFITDSMALRFGRIGSNGDVQKIWDVQNDPGSGWVTREQHSLKLTSLKDRGYFLDAKANRLWSFGMAGDRIRPFAAETVKSRIDGDVTLIVSRPVDPATEEVAYVAMATAPLLVRPRPPGVEFVVVDDQCRTLLHSQVGRSLVENLCEETEAPDLAAAVLARRDYETAFEYYGVTYDALVEPIAGSLWSLVVLRDRALVEANAAHVLLVTLVTLSPYFGLWILVVLGIGAYRHGYRAEWLWPDPSRRRPYVRATTLVAGIGLAVTGLASVGGLAAAVATFLLPLLTVGATHHLLTRTSNRIRRQTTRFPHGWVALMTAIIAVNGPLAALLTYRAVHDTTLVAVERRGQLRWMHDRFVRLPPRSDPSRIESLRREPYPFPFFDSAKLTIGDSLPASASEYGRLYGSPSSANTDVVRLLFEQPSGLVLSLLPWPGRNAAELSRVVDASASDGAWEWPPSPGLIRLVLREEHLRGLVGSPHAAARYRLRGPPNLAGTVGLGLLLAASLALLAILVRATALQLTSWRANGGAVASVPHSTVVLVWTGQPTGAGLEPRVAPFDFRAITGPSECAGAEKALRLETATTVVAEHLDARLVDPAWRGPVLALLERLVFTKGKTLVLLTALDPVPYVRRLAAEGQISGDEVNRWAELCAAATSKLIPGRDDIESAFGVLGIDRTLAQRARTSALHPSALERWPWLWARCTRAEKLALSQFADEGFFNPRAVPIVRRLLEQSLIVRDGALRFVDDGFRTFVRTAEPASVIHAWERAGLQSWWQTIRVPALAVLLAAAAFVFATQQEAANTATAAITAAAGALPVVLRLLATGSIGSGKKEET